MQSFGAATLEWLFSTLPILEQVLVVWTIMVPIS